MSTAEFVAKLNRRHKAALCATLICVGLIVLLSHTGVRPAVGILLLGIAFSWALGSNSRLVHWLFVASGFLLLIPAVGDALLWPRTKAGLIELHNSTIETDKEVVQTDKVAIGNDLSTLKQAEHDAALMTEVNKDLGTDTQSEFEHERGLRSDEEELRSLEAEGVFRRVVEIDWGTAVGGLLLLGAGLGLLVGVKPTRPGN